LNGKKHDTDALPLFDQMGRPAVHDDPAGTRNPFLNIGFKPGSAGDGGYEDFFPLPEVGQAHQVFRDGDASLVFDVGVGDHGPMELGF